ncbi:MAG: hypothetical protein ABI867_16535 [Kofleriaceae bacterium]
MSGIVSRLVSIPTDDIELVGDLSLPSTPCGLVLLVDERGAGRFELGHQRLAELWASRGLATLAVDLETPDEEVADRSDATLRFDPEFLAHRLHAATDWVLAQPELMELPLGYFGEGAAAAGALLAASRRAGAIAAVVSCGGRPDLVAATLPRLHAPTLFVVGANDRHVLALTASAAAHTGCLHRIQVIDHASHRFVEPGTLEAVGVAAADWFVPHFAPIRDSLREAWS